MVSLATSTGFCSPTCSQTRPCVGRRETQWSWLFVTLAPTVTESLTPLTDQLSSSGPSERTVSEMESLPKLCRSIVPLLHVRKVRLVTALSMGCESFSRRRVDPSRKTCDAAHARSHTRTRARPAPKIRMENPFIVVVAVQRARSL